MKSNITKMHGQQHIKISKFLLQLHIYEKGILLFKVIVVLWQHSFHLLQISLQLTMPSLVPPFPQYCSFNVKGMGEVIPVQAMRAYRPVEV